MDRSGGRGGVRLRLVAALSIAGTPTCEGGVTEPPNQAPGPRGTIPDQAIEVDSAVAVDVARYFADPDGDALTYRAMSASTATVAGDRVGEPVSFDVSGYFADPDGDDLEYSSKSSNRRPPGSAWLEAR